MSGRRADHPSARTGACETELLKQLFGRDLTAGGWVVTGRSERASRSENSVSDQRRRDIAPDLSIIWALKGRKR
ncbi:MAG: hypothetical protein O2912_01615 [Proteobacteria bacterium]|nr:hypothetical protein [Pseudomonadota bacterium]